MLRLQVHVEYGHMIRRILPVLMALVLCLAFAMPVNAVPDLNIVVIPDMQNYFDSMWATTGPEVSQSVNDWIVNNKTAYGIQAIISLGDIQNSNTGEGVAQDLTQWTRAKSKLSGLAALSDFYIATGNHDSNQGRNLPSTELNTYFPLVGTPTATMQSGKRDGLYRRITSGATTYGLLVLPFQFGAGAAIQAWAQGILTAYPTDKVIVFTHSFMFTDGSLTWEGSSMLWPLIKANDNVVSTFCGHEYNRAGYEFGTLGIGNKVVYKINDFAHTVPFILTNYQEYGATKGEGFINMVSITSNTMEVKTFSPYYQSKGTTNTTWSFSVSIT